MMRFSNFKKKEYWLQQCIPGHAQQKLGTSGMRDVTVHIVKELYELGCIKNQIMQMIIWEIHVRIDKLVILGENLLVNIRKNDQWRIRQ